MLIGTTLRCKVWDPFSGQNWTTASITLDIVGETVQTRVRMNTEDIKKASEWQQGTRIALLGSRFIDWVGKKDGKRQFAIECPISQALQLPSDSSLGLNIAIITGTVESDTALPNGGRGLAVSISYRIPNKDVLGKRTVRVLSTSTDSMVGQKVTVIGTVIDMPDKGPFLQATHVVNTPGSQYEQPSD